MKFAGLDIADMSDRGGDGTNPPAGRGGPEADRAGAAVQPRHVYGFVR